MTSILVTIASIFAFAGGAWTARKLLRIPVCPICVGVASTWLWMLIGRSYGYAVDATMLSMLLGGSVVGIAYLLEKRLPQGRSPSLWKALFIPLGFVAAYGLVESHWILFSVMAVALVLLAVFFLARPAVSEAPSEAVEELKRKMQQCC